MLRTLQAHEIWAQHGAWVTEHAPEFGPGTRERFEMAAAVTAQQTQRAAGQRAEIRQHLEALLGGDGVLALPTAPGPAPLLNTPQEELNAFRQGLLSLTCVAGLAGLPQVNLPIAAAEGCPVGLGLIGPPGSDEALLALTEELMGILLPVAPGQRPHA